jgi:hypothetical protein
LLAVARTASLPIWTCNCDRRARRLWVLKVSRAELKKWLNIAVDGAGAAYHQSSLYIVAQRQLKLKRTQGLGRRTELTRGWRVEECQFECLSVSFALRNLPRGAGRANGVVNYR